jgi:glycine/D-amino acid oxidase-like deaminating enzyme
MGTYAKRLQILPYTSVLSIDSPEYKQLPYTIHTSKGPIQTPRIVHATNAHVSHLVPSLRSKVVPVRLAVSVQRPGSKFLPDCKSGMRSWCLYYGKGFDFLGQLPKSPDGWGNGELLYGGGLVFAHNKGLGEAGNLDEATVDPQMESYLAGALPVYFGDSNWGAEGQPTKADIEGGWGEGRIKTVWSGIMGLSSDGPPWVGKLPCSLTPRKVIPEAGGEWVSAGFSGEGMVHAWGCGRGCAMMMLGLKDREGEELPKEFLITEDRVRKTSTEEMFEYLEEA